MGVFGAMTDFDARVARSSPSSSGSTRRSRRRIGEHAHDDRWPDLTAAGRAERLAFVDRWLAELRGDDRPDARRRDRPRPARSASSRRPRFAETELREDAWDPLDWVYLLGDGLFTLIAREFAPLADRLASIAGRLEGLPAVLDGGPRRRSSGTPAGRSGGSRPRRRSTSSPGIDELIDDALARGRGRAPTDPRRRRRRARA